VYPAFDFCWEYVGRAYVLALGQSIGPDSTRLTEKRRKRTRLLTWPDFCRIHAGFDLTSSTLSLATSEIRPLASFSIFDPVNFGTVCGPAMPCVSNHLRKKKKAAKVDFGLGVPLLYSCV